MTNLRSAPWRRVERARILHEMPVTTRWRLMLDCLHVVERTTHNHIAPHHARCGECEAERAADMDDRDFQGHDDYAEVDYDNCGMETPNAVLLRIDSADHWVPKRLLDSSAQTPVMNDKGGELGACFIERWFAEKEGLV